MTALRKTHFRRAALQLGVAISFALVGSAWAFPTWIGWCCSHATRQSPGSPTDGDVVHFEVLMNQDYAGLHGDLNWNQGGAPLGPLSMTYGGNDSGNSWWYLDQQWAPGTNYYWFRGWEDFSASEIFESNGGANYTLTVTDDDTTAPTVVVQTSGTAHTNGPMQILWHGSSAFTSGDGSNKIYTVTDGDLADLGSGAGERLTFNFAAWDASGLSRNAAGAAGTDMNYDIGISASPPGLQNIFGTYQSGSSAAATAAASAKWSVFEHTAAFSSSEIYWLLTNTVSGPPGLNVIRVSVPDADFDVSRAGDKSWVLEQQVGYLQVQDDDTDYPFIEGVALGGAFSNSAGKAFLEVGDLAFVGVNAAAHASLGKSCTLVALVDLAAGTVVSITDNGWLDDHTFREGEGTLTWTSPGNLLPAGTMITFTNISAAAGASTGSVVRSGSLDLSVSGDQLLVYQGASSSPSFICALQYRGASWDVDQNSANHSALPLGLRDDYTAPSFAHDDNLRYLMGTTSATREALIAAIGTPGNWEQQSSAAYDLPPAGAFTVSDGAAFVFSDGQLGSGGWLITGRVSDATSGINTNGTPGAAYPYMPFYVLINADGDEALSDQAFNVRPADGGATTLSTLADTSVDAIAPTDVVLGTWTVVVQVADNDADHSADEREATLYARFDVVDDDSVDPVFSVFTGNGSTLQGASFNDTDLVGGLIVTGFVQDVDSGIWAGGSNTFSLTRDGASVTNGVMSPNFGSGGAKAAADYMTSLLAAAHVQPGGIYTMLFSSVDYDIDRPGDGLSTSTALVFTVTVATPSISSNPGSLAFSHFRGDTPSAAAFTVTNTGGGTLNYTISTNQAWLHVAGAGGSLTAGLGAQHTVSLTSSNLAAGTHNATITVTDPAADNTPQTVSVSVVVSNLLSPTSIVAMTNTANSATRIDLSWAKWNSKDVMIVHSADTNLFTPLQGTGYAVSFTTNDDTVIYKAGGTSMTQSGLLPGATNYYRFYSENFGYYSSGTGATVTNARPQTQNPSGAGSPEAPASIFLGDTNRVFACDAWGTLDGNWGRARLVIDRDPDLSDGSAGAWGIFTNSEYRQVLSPQFTGTGTWYWAIQLDYDSPYGNDFWYINGNSSWVDLSTTPQSSLTVTVSALPGVTDTSLTRDEGPEALGLNWTRSGTYNAMVVRRFGAIPDAPTNGVVYTQGSTYGPAGRNFVLSAPGAASSTVDMELSPNTSSNYYYAFHTENIGYYSLDQGSVAAGQVNNTNTPPFEPGERVDAFTYFTGQSLNGRQGGNLWTNNWIESTPGEFTLEASSFGNLGGYRETHGNKIKVHPDAGETHTARRSFAPISSGSILASFVMNYTETVELNAEQFFVGVSFMNGGTEEAFAGLAFPSQKALSLTVDGVTTFSAVYDMSGGFGNDYIIFTKYDFDTRAFTAKGYFLSNSSVPSSEPVWDVTTNLNVGAITSIDGIRLGAGGTLSPGDVFFDEIRIGRSWAELLNNLIAFNSFEPAGASDNWTYSEDPGNGSITKVTDRKWSGGQSLQMCGSADQSNPSVTFTNISIEGFTNVVLSIAFSSDGPDANDDLIMDISYDNFTTTNDSVTLVNGEGGTGDDVAFGSISSATVDTNPFTTNISPEHARISVKVRFSESVDNNAGDCFYIDDIELSGQPSAEMGVIGPNNILIADGDLSGGTTDGTDFGTILEGATSTQAYAITNTGLETLLLTGTPAVTIVGDTDALSVAVQPASSNLAPFAGTEMQFTFDPPSVGLFTAVVSIANNDFNENPYNFQIRGEGIEPTILFQGFEDDPADTWAFGELSNNSIATNSTRSRSGDHSLSFNETTGTVTFANASIYGYTNVKVSVGFACTSADIGDDLFLELSYDDGATWTDSIALIDGLGGLDLAFEQTNLNQTVGQNAFYYSVSATHTQVSVRLRSEELESDDFFYIDDVRLTGYATPIMDVIGNGLVITNQDLTPSVADHTDFGSVIVASGTRARTFSITNAGIAALVLDGVPKIEIGGTHAADFDVDTQPVSPVAVGASTNIVIVFDPSALGLRSATVTISNGDLDRSPTTFAIQGYGVNNSNSVVEAPAAQVAAGAVSSIADTPAEAVDVFRFSIVDPGAGDQVATVVTQLTVRVAAGNSADWTDTLQGITLDAGGPLVITSTNITDSAITINLSAGVLSVADGSTNDVTLAVYLKANGATDGDVLKFLIDADDHGFSAAATGSAFDPNFAADVISNDQTVDVVATRLVLSETPSYVVIASNLSAVVQAQDENGNLDLGATASVAIFKNSGNGTLSGGTNQALVAGVRSWDELQINSPGAFVMRADAAGLASATSGTINAYILFHGFEDAPHENWEATLAPSAGTIETNSDRAYGGTQSLRFGGSVSLNADPFAVFDHADISDFDSVVASMAYSASGPDALDDLYVEVSYDGGASYAGAGTVQLVSGFSDAELAFGATNASNPTTVGANPYAFSVANTETQIQVRVRFDERSGVDNSADYYYLDNITLTGIRRDTNSVADAPGAQVAGGTMSSLADTSAEAVDVFTFDITDAGSEDGLTTDVVQITIRPGPSNTADWSDTIQDIVLRDSGGAIPVSDVQVTDGAITITIDPGDLSIADGASEELTLAVYLNTSGVIDNSVLQFLMDADNHGFLENPATGSRFATEFPADVLSNNRTIEVAASALAFASQRPPDVVGASTDFRVEVRAVDANGNTDDSRSDSIVLTKELGGGTLSAISGLTQPLASGTNLWADVNMDVPGTFRIRAATAGLTDAITGDLQCGGVWINEIDYDQTGVDTGEWIEVVGNAGFSLDDYEIVLIDSAGIEDAVWDLEPAGWTFTNEHGGFGFFVFGIVDPGEGQTDYTPAEGWTQNEIQNGPNDSFQLRRKAGAVNVHLTDYEGTNTNTLADQVTPLADLTTAQSSLYLSGGPGAWFTDFDWANTAGNSTPGALNAGQILNTVLNPPSVSNVDGASDVTFTEARLNGRVLSGYPFPDTFIYWGDTPGGTSPGAWDNVINLGEVTWRNFSSIVSGLATGETYYYRTYVSNALGVAWAETNASFTTVSLFPVSPFAASYFDNIGIGSVMPLSIDRDGDSMSDRWEDQYLGGIATSDGSADADSDGVSDRREFIGGTDPGNAASYVSFVSADLASEGSDNVSLAWTGGTFNGDSPYAGAGDNPVRTYRVRVGTAGGGSKSGASAVADGLTGLNSWTDVDGANLYTARYYDLSISYGAQAYTNTQEWAMHRQNRPSGKKYFITVPVDYGSTNANSLSSTLGHQLGRGLHPDNLLISPDTIEILNDESVWKEYSLVTNASGQMYWWDADIPGPATVSVRAGTGIFVTRGSASAERANTVFVGRSWTDASVADIPFGTNYSGWTAFGWPLPTPRSHVNSGTNTAANQLGFAGLGSGGTGNLFDPQSKGGDRIWVWDNSGGEWQTFYELLGNVGPNWDGRWWHSNAPGGPGFADFTFTIGRGYFYRHVVNQWGGTNFVWRPVSP